MSKKNRLLHRGAPRSRRSLPLILERLELRIAPTGDINVFNNVGTESALRSDLAAAASNSYSENIINLSAEIGQIAMTGGQLVIDNATNAPKTLVIEGQGQSPSSTVIQGSSTRVFEIVGTSSAGMTVVFKDLEVTLCWG